MWGRGNQAYENDALFREHCEAFLAGDEAVEPVGDEVVYAYIAGRASEVERAEVEDALLKSRSFCAEVLELAQYMDSLERPESGEEKPGFLGAVRALLRRPRLALTAAAAAVVMVAAVYVAQLWRAPSPLPGALHLVVLPVDCGGDTSGAAFCDGLAATMTQQVSFFERSNRSFWVVPADAVARADVSDPRSAGDRFGATVALTSRFQRLGDEFRLTLDLVNLLSPVPTPLRSVQIAGPMTDLARLQVTAARRIGEMLGVAPVAAASLAAGGTPVAEAYQSYLEGRGHLLRYEQNAELQAAADAFESALAADSTYALARTGLAEAYWRMFRNTRNTEWIERARSECNRSLALAPELAQTRVVLGNIQNASGEYEQAAETFEQAVAMDSTTTGVYNGLAESYARMERLDEAEATYRRAIAVKPDFWGGYNDLGLFYYRHGRYGEAADQYRRVSELTPDNDMAFNNLAAMYYYLERWDDARQAFRRSIEIRPTDRAYLNLGSIYYIEGDYDSAAVYSERAIALNENNYKAWSALGNALYWVSGQRDRAIEAYRHAIDLAEKLLALNPRDQRVRVKLASYYVVVGEPDTARSYIETALESSPDSYEILYYAGYVYEQVGQRDRALELIGRAIDRGYPVSEIEQDPFLSDLRADERFQQMLDERK